MHGVKRFCLRPNRLMRSWPQLMKRFAAKKQGEAKTILFGLTGTGYFDMTAYIDYQNGTMTDTIPTDEDLEKGVAQLPKVEG